VLAHGFQWGEFVSAIPEAAIKANTPALQDMPANRRDCITSFGALRGDLDATLKTLDERRSKESELWTWLDSVEHYTDEATLSDLMSMRSGLFSRLGPKEWLEWATKLPHPVFIVSAIDDIDDLDFIEATLVRYKDAAVPESARSLTALVLVRRAVELWERVDMGLAQAVRVASMGMSVSAADRAEYERSREEWTKIELPSRVKRVATLILAGQLGSDVPAVVAKHLRTVPGQRTDAAPIRAMLRDELVQRLTQADPDGAISTVMAGALAPGLLAAAMVAAQAPTLKRCEKVLEGYKAWLASEEFFWTSPLDGDDGRLVEALARLVMACPNPSVEAKRLLEAVTRPAQGWGFDLDAWFDSVERVAHVLIVLASATGSASKPSDAEEVMELTWIALDALLMNAPMVFDEARLNSAVAYVWAHATRSLKNGPTRIAEALGRIDDVRLMLSAAGNFARNSGGVLPVDAQRAIRAAFEMRIPVLERHPHIPAADFASLQEKARELAGAAYDT
jgi:hypothetical protein